MTTQEPFVIVRSFDAPRDLVWKAWTEPERMVQWFGPKGSSGEILEYDLRPGGLWRGRMQSAEGQIMFNRFKFREVTPPSRLVWEHSFANEKGEIAPAPMIANWPLVLLTTVTFEADGNRTTVTLTWMPLDASETERAIFESAKPGMTQGWGGSYERLDGYLKEMRG